MAEVPIRSREHYKTFCQKFRFRRTRRENVNGAVQVQCLIKEVEVRTNVKLLVMSQSEETDPLELFRHETSPTLDREWNIENSSSDHLRDKSDREFDVECSESSDAEGVNILDVIDIDDNKPNCTLKTNMKKSLPRAMDVDRLAKNSSRVVVISDDDQSGELHSDSDCVDIVLNSDEEEPFDLSMPHVRDPSVCPVTRLNSSLPKHSLPLLKSAESTDPLESSGSEAVESFHAVPMVNRSSFISPGDEESTINDGNEQVDSLETASDLSNSQLSVNSGPSNSWTQEASNTSSLRGLCLGCQKLCVKMMGLSRWTKIKATDPACLDFDQWVLLKMWKTRGHRGYCRTRGKLFEHLPRLWRLARSPGGNRTEEPCARPHVFLNRNLQMCQRSCPGLPQKVNRKPRRGPRYEWPPIGFYGVRHKKKKRKQEERKIEKVQRVQPMGRKMPKFAKGTAEKNIEDPVGRKWPKTEEVFIMEEMEDPEKSEWPRTEEVLVKEDIKDPEGREWAETEEVMVKKEKKDPEETGWAETEDVILKIEVKEPEGKEYAQTPKNMPNAETEETERREDINKAKNKGKKSDHEQIFQDKTQSSKLYRLGLFPARCSLEREVLTIPRQSHNRDEDFSRNALRNRFPNESMMSSKLIDMSLHAGVDQGPLSHTVIDRKSGKNQDGLDKRQDSRTDKHRDKLIGVVPMEKLCFKDFTRKADLYCDLETNRRLVVRLVRCDNRFDNVTARHTVTHLPISPSPSKQPNKPTCLIANRCSGDVISCHLSKDADLRGWQTGNRKGQVDSDDDQDTLIRRIDCKARGSLGFPLGDNVEKQSNHTGTGYRGQPRTKVKSDKLVSRRFAHRPNGRAKTRNDFDLGNSLEEFPTGMTCTPPTNPLASGTLPDGHDSSSSLSSRPTPNLDLISTPVPSTWSPSNSEISRKLRPFRRTYERGRTRDNGFKSILNLWARRGNSIIRETDLW